MAELGRQGGQKNRRWKVGDCDVPHRSVKTTAEVIELLEETINRVRQGSFDPRAANTIGVLTRDLLKAREAAASSAKTGRGAASQLYAKRLYLPDWRREVIEKLQKQDDERRASGAEVPAGTSSRSQLPAG